MIVLDASVVTIALPSAQRALGISIANRQWVMTAYTLAFGGLLLLGGRIADYFGRKRMFVISLLGFAGASALGGLAQNSAMLFALEGAAGSVRRGHGAFCSIAHHSDVHRSEGKGEGLRRLRRDLRWRRRDRPHSRRSPHPVRIMALDPAHQCPDRGARGGVRHARSAREPERDSSQGIRHRGRRHGNGRPAVPRLRVHTGRRRRMGIVADPHVHGAGGRAAHVLRADRAAAQAIPCFRLRVVLDRNRGGSFIAALLVGIAMFATFLFLTYYFQGTLGYSAVRTGFAFLPFSLGIISGATLSSRFLPRFGPRVLMVAGFALAACGLFLFTGIGVHTSYLAHLLPAEVIVSFGMGTAFVPLSSTALIGVDPSDAGVASAMVNTTQQTGASLGVSLLNTVAATATANFLLHHGTSQVARAEAFVHGYTVSFTISAVLLVTAAVTTLLILRTNEDDVAAAEFGLEPGAGRSVNRR